MTNFSLSDVTELVKDFHVETEANRTISRPYYYSSNEDPFQLCFIPSASHAHGRENNCTFDEIDKVNFQDFKVVFVEGIRTSKGKKFDQNTPDEQRSEGDYAIKKAVENGVKWLGAEMDYDEYFKKANEKGISNIEFMNSELLGHMRQWNGEWEKSKDKAEFDERVDKGEFRILSDEQKKAVIDHEKKAFFEDKIRNYLSDPEFNFLGKDKPSIKDFEDWYEDNKPVGGTKKFYEVSNRDLAPINNPESSRLQQISFITERIRDEHLMKMILDAKEHGTNCLVVYGNSHFQCLRDGFKQEIGNESLVQPGTDMHNALNQYFDANFKIPTINVPLNCIQKSIVIEK